MIAFVLAALLAQNIALPSPPATPIHAQVETDTEQGGRGNPIDGIPCSTQEQLAYHEHAYLALFNNGQRVAIPLGIGLTYQQGGTPCLYWLHTHDPSGVLHIEAEHEITPTLGDLFAIWGVPLASDRVANLHGPVTGFSNGARITQGLASVPIHADDSLVLDVGPTPANEIFHETWPAKPGVAFAISTGSGTITVSASNQAYIDVRATVRGSNTAAASVLTKVTGERLAVWTDYAPVRDVRAYPFTDYVISVPVDTHLDLHTSNGDIVLANVGGAVTASTNRGSLALNFSRPTQGNIAFSTRAGNVCVATLPASVPRGTKKNAEGMVLHLGTGTLALRLSGNIDAVSTQSQPCAP